MASPQLEDGHVRIANEIIDQLAKQPLSSGEFRVLLLVIRKTYGWGKKWDKIPITQFVKGTEMHRSATCKILKRLVSNGTLLKGEKGYAFNKNWHEWVVSHRQQSSKVVSHRQQTSVQRATQLVSNGTPSKDNTKDTNKRHSAAKKLPLNAKLPKTSKSTRKRQSDPDECLTLTQFTDEIAKNPQRHVQIIGGWAKIAEPDCRTRKQWRGFIRRHLRAAKELTPFTDEQIQEGYEKLAADREENPKYLRRFTLETLLKYVIK